MEERKSSWNTSENSEMINIEKRITEALHELNFKRAVTLFRTEEAMVPLTDTKEGRNQCQVDELRCELSTSNLAKSRLEQTVDSARNEAQEVRLQHDVALSALRRAEEERSSSRDDTARLKVQFEVAARERDMLKDCYSKLKQEYEDLKRKHEQSDDQIRLQATSQETLQSKQTRNSIILEQVQIQVKALEDDMSRTEKISSAANDLCQKAALLLQHYRKQLMMATEAKEEMSKKVFSLTAEVDHLKLELKLAQPFAGGNSGQGDQTYMQEWLLSLSEMKERVSAWNEESDHVCSSLQSAMQETLHFQALQEKAQLRANELEEELQRLRGSLQKPACVESGQQTGTMVETTAEEDTTLLQQLANNRNKPTFAFLAESDADLLDAHFQLNASVKGCSGPLRSGSDPTKSHLMDTASQLSTAEDNRELQGRLS